MSARVDVLAVFAKLMTFGGTFEPRRIVAEWNRPRGTAMIRSHTGAKSAAVRRALTIAERDGLVVRVPNPSSGWNDNAAQRAEHYWQLTDAGLARIGGGA